MFFGIDLVERLAAFGLPLLALIVFAETGLFIGCFLPGDSLLIAAGFVSALHPEKMPIQHVLMAVPLAAVLGDQLNYYIGRTAGNALYHRESTRFFRRDHLLATKEFFEKYGPVALILARFVPFARSFAPAVAGIGQMQYRRFVTFSVLGGLIWAFSMCLVGYYFGQIPFVQQHIEMLILLVIFVSVLPVVITAWRTKKNNAAKAAAAEVSAEEPSVEPA